MHKIGFLIADGSSFLNYPPNEICEQLSSLGYRGVEWSTGFLNPYEKGTNEIKEVISISNVYGLEVGEVVVQKDYVTIDNDEWEQNVQYTIKCIEVYSEVGIKTINLFTGPRPWIDRPVKVGRDITFSKAWGKVFSAFDRIVPVAERYGMNLAVEGVWGHLCRDFFSTWYLVNSYNSAVLGVNYDPSHDVLNGMTDVSWVIKQWGIDKIKNVHIKDAVGWYLNDTVGEMKDSRFVFPLPGEGKVNWKEFISSLDEIGYGGVMSVEFESFDYLNNIWNGDSFKAAELSICNLRKVFGEND